MNILVVDDHPNLVRITAMALRALGCGTFTARNTATATQLLGTEKIDAIFLDVNLGGESGMDFLSQLVAQACQPPVIMFTAQAKDEVAGEAFRRGAFGCLIKPFNLEDLSQQMNRLEQHRRDGLGENPSENL